MANIEKSKDIHKAINETLINAFNKRSMKVLSSRSVSKEQYFYWALDRSRKNIFLSGLVISSIFISFFIYIWLSQSNNLDPSFSELFVASAIPFFFIIMFTVLVIAAKRGTLFGVSDRNFQNLSWGYYMMDVLRRTSHKSITKISEKTWTQIKAFDLIAAKERFNPKWNRQKSPILI